MRDSIHRLSRLGRRVRDRQRWPQALLTAADFTMKIGFVTINDQNQQWANWYKEAVEKGSNGRIEVQIYPASQLGPVPRQIEGVQLGTIEAVLLPADFFVGLDPRYGVFSIPGLFKDMKNAAAAIADPELNKEILALGESKGMVGHHRLCLFGCGLFRERSDPQARRLQGQEIPHQCDAGRTRAHEGARRDRGAAAD